MCCELCGVQCVLPALPELTVAEKCSAQIVNGMWRDSGQGIARQVLLMSH